MKFLCLCCLLLACVLQAAVAGPATVVLHDSQATIDLASHLETFGTEETGLSIEQVSSAPYRHQFKPNAVAATNYGYHNQPFWLRFNIRSESSADWYLVLDYLKLGEADIFILPAAASDKAAGLTIPAELFSHVESYRSPVWKLKLPGNQDFSVYLRLYNPKNSLVLSASLMQGQAFITYSSLRYMFFAAFFAGIFVLVLYNIFLSTSLRDKSYLIFALFIFLLGLSYYRVANLFPGLFDLLVNPKNWYHIGLLFLTQGVATYYWSIIHRNNDERLAIFMKAIAWASFALCILSCIYTIHINVFNVLFLAALLIIPSLMIRPMIRGQRNAFSSFLSMLLFMLSVAIVSPLYSGYFPEYPLISLDVSYVVMLLSILLFSLNHADRSRQIREQAERAEANNKAIHNFLTTMSHELRTPMHTVISANELLKTTPLGRVQKSYLGSLELAARQMLRLVDDILDIARLNGSQQILINEEPFNLYQLLTDIENLFSIQAKQQPLAFSVKFGNIPYPYVLGDDKRLSQILVNLIGNAIKHAGTGKITLQVSAETSLSRLQLETQTVHFSVQDSGPGIPAVEHDLLFQPFYQPDSSRSRCQEGAGLGLSISAKLVALMGGELLLDSKPGQGSRFFFALSLPIHTSETGIRDKKSQLLHPVVTPAENPVNLSAKVAEADNEPHHEPDEQPLRGVRILLVDDGELNLMISKELLSLQGAVVSAVISGADALRYLDKHSVDLVLMDVSMPGMDGYQATRLIRENENLRTLPVIALTAHAIGGEKERCLAAGMNDYVSKPFQIEHLLSVLLKYCN